MVRMLRSNTISCTQTRPRPCQSISANERKSDWCRQKKIVSNQDRCSGHIRLESVEMHIYEYESRQFTWNQQIKNVPEDWSRLPQPKSCRHADRSLPGNSHVQFLTSEQTNTRRQKSTHSPSVTTLQSYLAVAIGSLALLVEGHDDDCRSIPAHHA